MKLIKLYTSILNAAGAVVDKDGFVSDNKAIYGGENSPLLIKGKRLVLPTTEQLRSMGKGNTIAFHPLYENIMRRESEVITTLRKMISVRLSYTVASVMNNLLTIATSVKEHAKLTPDQGEFLSIIKDVDATTSINFTKYLSAVAKANEATHMCHLYLKHGGKIGENRYSRVSVVTFAAYTEIKEHTDLTKSLRGVRFRIKDRDAILKLFEYVFPDIDKLETYSVGSNSNIAPYMDALMRSFYNVAAKLNDVFVLFGNKIDHVTELTFDSDWVDSFQDLSLLDTAIRSIPMQAGNEGETRSHGAVPANNNTVTQSAVVTPITPPQAPVVAPIQQQFQPQVQVAQPTPVMQQQVPQPVQQNELVTSNGVNFRALMSGRGGMVQQQYPQQMQPTYMHGGYNGMPQQMQQPYPMQQPYQQQPYFNQYGGMQQPIQRVPYGGVQQQYPQQPTVRF